MVLTLTFAKQALGGPLVLPYAGLIPETLVKETRR
jgi:hypothetical protein